MHDRDFAPGTIEESTASASAVAAAEQHRQDLCVAHNKPSSKAPIFRYCPVSLQTTILNDKKDGSAFTTTTITTERI
jgi:hypothetical protein